MTGFTHTTLHLICSLLKAVWPEEGHSNFNVVILATVQSPAFMYHVYQVNYKYNYQY